ncbi:MAG: Fic family protein [Bacteroidota bacterium]
MNSVLTDNLRKIDSFKFKLEDWDQEMIEQVKTSFTYYSNKIEGNALTYGETIAVLKNHLKPANRSLQDIFSIKNHKKFVDLLFASYQSDFSLKYIKDLHSQYMESIFQWAEGTGDNYSPGVLKWDTNGTIRPNGTYKTYMGPDETPDEVEKLCALVNDQLNNKKTHPVITASYFHQRFIGEIHPFVDGNGRLGRMLTNQILLKGGLSPATFNLNQKSKMAYLKMMDTAVSTDPSKMQQSHIYFSKLVLKTSSMKNKRQKGAPKRM